MNSENVWEKIKESITETADRVLGKKTRQNRKPWITKDIVELIEERRKLKNSHKEEHQAKYRMRRNRINREAKIAKDRHIAQKCEEIENDLKTEKIDRAYKNIKTFLDERKIRTETESHLRLCWPRFLQLYWDPVELIQLLNLQDQKMLKRNLNIDGFDVASPRQQLESSPRIRSRRLPPFSLKQLYPLPFAIELALGNLS
ncbi:hypothetical protein ILUMI_15610 [Ignelater luminosus]|uniref:Uncharacterized protein n=1 Tax=Ignelater luminosus TaxID=2038154 RepID=A0A8K0G9R4_IGNLU|nr:hypothetical protein ILUMI_15610 [Ignelater luminosus]